jgi:hypothetical protein
MENWVSLSGQRIFTVAYVTQGLITGRTDMYCLDPKRPSLPVKKRIATTQSHEVAHQWFGNIATMEWWDNLYLVCIIFSSRPLSISPRAYGCL